MEIGAGNTLRGRALPKIIQGGMGIAVSSWQLARAVALEGEMGVISATAIDSVMVRELQNGDPHDRLGMLSTYPDQEVVTYIRDQFYVPGGKPDHAPYKLLPIHRFNPTVLSQRILSAAAYSEVKLAKQGHEGFVGVNIMTKLKRHVLASMYGCMLAGVDAVLIGAGIPIEEADAMRRLALGLPAKLKLDVETPKGVKIDPVFYELDPANLVPIVEPLAMPAYFPIIASDVLAGILLKKIAPEIITGWIIEGPVAGGHNAPPRNKGVDEDQNPVYDERDIADCEKLKAMGLPFYLAGGFGTPEGLKKALALGAVGVQIGSLFSLANESGYPLEYKRSIIGAIHRREVRVRTDGRLSPTGFPFKALEKDGTLGMPSLLAQRRRICDLGYLQTPYLDEKGRIAGRCPSEPVETYVAKGGAVEDTVRRGCLCNGLMANIGLAQIQKWGEELCMYTAGDEIVNLPLGSLEDPSYSAADAIRHLKVGLVQEIAHA